MDSVTALEDAPDALLAQRAADGDELAFAVIVRRHAPYLRAYVIRLTGSSAEADDAVQDAFIQLWTHAARWEPGRAKFGTWLYRVTINKCYDRLRRRPTASLEAAAEVPDPTPGPDANLQNAALTLQIAAALAALPERQRAAIQLCHYQGCGNIEAAEILEISVEALESLLARGRRTLRTRLEHLRDETLGHD